MFNHQSKITEPIASKETLLLGQTGSECVPTELKQPAQIQNISNQIYINLVAKMNNLKETIHATLLKILCNSQCTNSVTVIIFTMVDKVHLFL